MSNTKIPIPRYHAVKAYCTSAVYIILHTLYNLVIRWLKQRYYILKAFEPRACSFLLFRKYVSYKYIMEVKVKQFRYRPGVAQRVPGS